MKPDEVALTDTETIERLTAALLASTTGYHAMQKALADVVGQNLMNEEAMMIIRPALEASAASLEEMRKQLASIDVPLPL
nr:hypothetical protein [uncultured Rhodopila sp.]